MAYFTDGIMVLTSNDNGRRNFRHTASGFLILLAGILLFGALPAVAATTQTPAQALDSNKIIQGHLKILKSPTNPLETRKLAAGLLMDLEVPGSKEQLLKILCDASDKQARLAVIEAIADRDEPASEFQSPLVEILLAGETDLQAAASKALGSFRNNPKLTKQLIGIAGDTKRPASQRLPAIDTLGKMRSETTVEALIKIMEAALSYPAGEQNEFENACGKSLTEITRVDLGANLGAWKTWWEKNRRKTKDQWLESQLDVVINENRELKKRLEQTETALIERLGQLFRSGSTNDADRIKIIQGYLAGSLPAERRAGLVLLTEFISPKQPIPPALGPAIRDLIDDTDPQVRKSCAKVVGESQDHLAVADLLKQLEVETDFTVKQAILVALGQLGDKSLLDIFIQQLNSPVEPVSIGAIRGLTKYFQNQKKFSDSQKNQLIQALLKRYQQANDDQIQLKQEILATMGIIGDYRFQQLFEKELTTGTSPDLRLYAARGLAKLGYEKLVDILIKQLNDPDPGVRAELAGGIADLTSDPHAVEMLLAHTNPNIETVPQVRQNTWNAILAMVKKWRIDEQLQWANKLTLMNDSITQDQMAALADALGTQIQDQSAALPTDQRIGLLINLGKFLLKTPRAEDAVKYFRQVISLGKQLAPEEPLKFAQKILNELFQMPATDIIIAQYFNNLLGVLEPDQLETMINRLLDWADHAANAKSAVKICRYLSKDLLNSIPDNLRTRLMNLANKYTPDTVPVTGPARANTP